MKKNKQPRADKMNAERIVAIKHILKSAQKTGIKPGYKGIFQCGEKFCVYDGYRIVIMPHDIKSLPHTKGGRNIVKEIAEMWKQSQKQSVQLPTISELKRAIEIWKADGKNGIPYIVIDNGKRYVNAQYLLDMMQAVPDCIAYAANGSCEKIYFCDKDGIKGGLATLMPWGLKENDKYVCIGGQP